MKITNVLCLFASTLVLGCVAEVEGEEDLSTTTSSVLTKGDTDVPAECQGILTYVNSASLQTLDAFLPSDVALNIVTRRSQRPFTDLIDLSSVSGVAQARISLIAERARAAGQIGPACVGVYEELGVSADDRAAIFAYINTVTPGELQQVVRFQAENTVPALLAGRPYSSLQALVDTYGVSLETFRSIRDAAIDSPFDVMNDAINTQISDTTLTTAFDVFDTLANEGGRTRYLTCFGLDPQLVASFGGTMRPNLATGAEVLAEVQNTAGWANRFGGLPSSVISAGLADAANFFAANQTFAGCIAQYTPDPWSGVNRSFFVNTRTGYRVLNEIRWSE
jgi:hypothetical protein